MTSDIRLWCSSPDLATYVCGSLLEVFASYNKVVMDESLTKKLEQEKENTTPVAATVIVRAFTPVTYVDHTPWRYERDWQLGADVPGYS